MEEVVSSLFGCEPRSQLRVDMLVRAGDGKEEESGGNLMDWMEEGRENGVFLLSQGPRQKSRPCRMYGEQIPMKRARGEEGAYTKWRESSKASIIRVSFASLGQPPIAVAFASQQVSGGGLSSGPKGTVTVPTALP